MAAYLPIGVVINMRGNNQPFVWGLETASGLAEQMKMFSQVMCICLLGQEREAVGKTAKFVW